MSTIALSFTSSGSTVYNFIIDKFLDDALPRSYSETANFSFSVSGSAILTGPAQRQRHIWAITTPMDLVIAEEFDGMYKEWDEDRSSGLAVALGLIDSTFGDAITTNAIFTTAPTYARFGPAYRLVSFGLTEV